MNEEIDVRKTKDRSPAFPFISLRSALERARQFYDEEKRGVAPYTRASMHWNYSPTSSGALQTTAALKHYGLMVDAGGSGQGRQVRLTDLALHILLDQRPDSEDRAAFIRDAAMSPSVAAEIYSKWPDGLPSDSTLNHYLVLEKKFNEATALKTLRIIKENQAFASIYSIDSKSDHDKIEVDSEKNTGTDMEVLDTSRMSETLGRMSLAPSMKAAPSGKEIGTSIPVTSSCFISIAADGDVTQDGIDRLIAYLNLIKGSFPRGETQ